MLRSLKLTVRNLKMDAWNTRSSFRPIFRGVSELRLFQGVANRYGRLALEPPLGKKYWKDGWKKHPVLAHPLRIRLIYLYRAFYIHHSMSQNGNLSPILKIKIYPIPQPGRYLEAVNVLFFFLPESRPKFQLKQRGHLDFIYVYIRGNHNVKGAPLKESIRTFFRDWRWNFTKHYQLKNMLRGTFDCHVRVS